jgi:hypothetical protein
MEAVTGDQPPDRNRLYNSELETGTRAMVILEAAYPRALDLSQLTWFDHLVVHTDDIGGPPSLHPPLPGRTGELLVRRRLVEESLTFMRRLHLIDTVADERGIAYRAGEDVRSVVGLMKTPYATALKRCAQWLISELGDLDQAELTRRINERIGRWAVEFQGEFNRPGQSS